MSQCPNVPDYLEIYRATTFKRSPIQWSHGGTDPKHLLVVESSFTIIYRLSLREVLCHCRCFLALMPMLFSTNLAVGGRLAFTTAAHVADTLPRRNVQVHTCPPSCCAC